jgi:outer membrane protein assembly factor BamB
MTPEHGRFPLCSPARWRFSCVFLSLLLILLAANGSSAQSAGPSSLTITPGNLVLGVGEDYALWAIDATGRPVSGAEWTISAPIAGLHVVKGEVFLDAKTSGRAILTATQDGQSASATISVLPGQTLPPGTVRWSLPPTPGFETLMVFQAFASNGSSVAFHSIEWSKSSNAIVRAFRSTGQQLWMTHLSSTASPLTLKQHLPPYARTFFNGEVVTNLRQILTGDPSLFASFDHPELNAPGLPLDGSSNLLRGSPDDYGGLLLLERGRFRDSLGDLDASDGHESWRYRSDGRLSKNWSVNRQGDVAIVEYLPQPVSSALIVLNGKTGEVRFRIPFPLSSTIINGFKCSNSNVLSNLRSSPAGSVFTSNDDNMYVQVEVHKESTDILDCKPKQYSFDNSLLLLQVTPDGLTNWKTFQNIHADGAGGFVVQPRVFAGESIPDGFGGVLAAWTYFFPGSKSGEKPRFQTRLSRIGPSGQRDFTLPMPFWTPGITTPFEQNMILGEGNPLYATNGPLLLRFDTESGELIWVRHPPTGEVRLRHATAGGGLLVSNAGRLTYFDAKGNGVDIAWTVPTTVLEDVGLAQSNLFDHSPAAPLLLRDVQFCWAGDFIAVEDGAPNGRGALVFFVAQ